MAEGSNRTLTFVAAAGSLVLLAAVVLMLWPSDPTDYTLTSGREQIDGETIGWVSKVEANTIHVNSGPFGGGVVPLVVTRNTRISVGSKEGWFEDIRPGGQVKVAYEIHNGKRLARTVEILVDDGPRRPIRAEQRLRSVTGGTVTAEGGATKTTVSDAATTDVIRPSPGASAPEPAPATTSASAGGTAAPKPPAPTTRPASVPSSGSHPTIRVEPPTAQAVEKTPARASTGTPRSNGSTEAVSRTADSPRPAATVAPSSVIPAPVRSVDPSRTPDGGGTTDGSDAVDWLLKRR